MRFYTNSITSAVYTILSSWEPLINSGTIIEHLPFMNTDQTRTPWIAVFRPTINYDPLRSNIISPFNVQMVIPIFSQVAYYGEDLEVGMMCLQDQDAEIFSAVSCYRALLDSVVNIWNAGDIQPYDEDRFAENNIISSQHQLIVEVFA